MKTLDIRDVIDELEMQNDFNTILFDKETYEFLMITEDGEVFGDGLEDLEQDELEELIESDRFISIPSSYDINAYKMMEDFIETLTEDLKGDFYICIRGKGAFRRFKEMASHKGIIEDWYNFKDATLKEIATTWCERNDIAYIDLRSISND